MIDMKLLIALLPAVFIFHDFEEIIMFKPWLDKNRKELKQRFPKFENFLVNRHFFDYSTSGFSVAVLHEFLFLAVITYFSLYFKNFQWWFAVFMAYFIHLFVHIGQWIIYRKYVPVIITSILTLPYCFYTFKIFIETTSMTAKQMFLWTIIGIILTIASLLSALYFASKFERWKNRKYHLDKK